MDKQSSGFQSLCTVDWEALEGVAPVQDNDNDSHKNHEDDHDENHENYRIKPEEGAGLLYCLHITPVVELRVRAFEPSLINWSALLVGEPSIRCSVALLRSESALLRKSALLSEEEGCRLRWRGSRYRLQCHTQDLMPSVALMIMAMVIYHHCHKVRALSYRMQFQCQYLAEFTS